MDPLNYKGKSPLREAMEIEQEEPMPAEKSDIQRKAPYLEYEEYQNRVASLQELRQLGIDPYPHHYEPTHSLGLVEQTYGGQEVGFSDDAAAGATPFVKVAGRLLLSRPMGKNIFGHLQQGVDRLQLMFNRDLTEIAGYPRSEDQPLSPHKLLEKKIDLGDILGVEGHLFRTQKGELTLFVKQLHLLSKALLPPADKHAGLTHKETRYRKRWLDLMSHKEVYQLFCRRSQILAATRRYFETHHFLEVETPVIQSLYGGAEARPFTTELHALKQQMFLRISLELSLKKLIIGGFDRVFEMGRVFRNEGIDRNHNPEFTMLEAYAAFWDYKDMMRLVEGLFESVTQTLYGTTMVEVPHPDGKGTVQLDFKGPWRTMTMKESLRHYAQIDVDGLSDDQMRHKLRDSGHVDGKKLTELSRGLLIAALFEVEVEHQLIQPHHITDHPAETTPLCKPHRSKEGSSQGLVERFESFILGNEICNAYTELNDPLLQRQLLEKQAERREAGDEEASPLDEEFLEAICQGMPPTGGIGIGMDRMVMLLTKAHSIRDVLLFPWMKPVDEATTS